MSKKIFLEIIVVILLAIGGWHIWGTESAQQNNQVNIVQQNGQKNNEKKSIVVYFSYTGNTRVLAKQIQKMTDSDIFEIQPEVPYSKDYDTVVDQGKKEVDEGYKPKLKEKVPDLAKYDVVYVGTPIWWYTITCYSVLFDKSGIGRKNNSAVLHTWWLWRRT
ncbi:flavodoxin [Pectinatus brassicae]|uniref:Flavodoxin-like domain-containing protein n=1 Tax=Pectinatus brassicae TaxID=862415 RepID=A0A840UHP6_9FIRM|nr:flavodoxin [Pectinatus brassicae]MBB5337261.1 hypothetical protein [Pectinatus brassicae]